MAVVEAQSVILEPSVFGRETIKVGWTGRDGGIAFNSAGPVTERR